MMQKIIGFKIMKKNMGQVNTILQRAKENLGKVATNMFHDLYAEEIEKLIDEIALGITDIPSQDIMEVAKTRLFAKISFAESNNLPTCYNLVSAARIFPQEDAVYILFFSSNADFENAFRSTAGIEEFGINISDNTNITEKITRRLAVWEKIKEADEQNPSIFDIRFTHALTFDKSKLSFASKMDRCNQRARHNFMNRRINMYACGEQIAPQDLMFLTDNALADCMTPAGEAEIKEQAQKLMSILPEITFELLGIDDKKSAEDSEATKDDSHCNADESDSGDDGKDTGQ